LSSGNASPLKQKQDYASPQEGDTTMWLEDFPIPIAEIPERLKRLVETIEADPGEAMVEVAVHYEHDPYGPDRENILMQTSVVPESAELDFLTLRRADFSVVSTSVPVADRKGDIAEFAPSIGGHDYIVASWGGNSFYNFYLAEKVWMALGLSARTVGGDHQRVIFDDLSEPLFGVADGEASNEYEWTSRRAVNWRMRSDYLHRYLWMRASRGVRHFYYSKSLPWSEALDALLGARDGFVKDAEDGRYRLDLRPFKGAVLLQLWGVAAVLEPQLSQAPSAEHLVWPGDSQPMTRDRANALIHSDPVFIWDTFLDRYEQDSNFECQVAKIHGSWHTSPSYREQWSFTDCVRVGRNAIRVSTRELYKPKPDREILHAYAHVMDTATAAAIDADEPHIVMRVDRIVSGLLRLADGLATLGARLQVVILPETLFALSREKISADGWRPYPEIRRLARIAHREMSQGAFLTRCKALNELIQRVPAKPLKRLLACCGCINEDTAQLRSFKLLQGLFTLLQEIEVRGDDWTGLAGLAPEIDWRIANLEMAPLFQLNDLRNAEAHENFEEVRQPLEAMGFDTALLNGGYGLALDYVFDRIAAVLETICNEIDRALED
jgi:hypothetical protein